MPGGVGDSLFSYTDPDYPRVYQRTYLNGPAWPIRWINRFRKHITRDVYSGGDDGEWGERNGTASVCWARGHRNFAAREQTVPGYKSEGPDENKKKNQNKKENGLVGGN